LKVYEQFGVRLNPLHPINTTDVLKGLPISESLLSEYNPKQKRTMLRYGVGIEVEAERAKAFNSHYWEITADNSLRDNGIEFRTFYGYRIAHLPAALLELQAQAGKFSFSERTSVHVHIDVRNTQIEEVGQMFLLYLLFEKSLFRFAGAHREHNVFCVPFNQSSKCTKPHSWLALINGAEKYTALNLAPVAGFGTVEYRHMAGNADAQHIFNWVMLIAHMKYYATHTSYDKMKEKILGLKTNSRFNAFRDEVFQAYSPMVIVDSREIDEAVTVTKLFI